MGSIPFEIDQFRSNSGNNKDWNWNRNILVGIGIAKNGIELKNELELNKNELIV